MCQSQQGKNQLNERKLGGRGEGGEGGVGVTSFIKLSLPPKAYIHYQQV